MNEYHEVSNTENPKISSETELEFHQSNDENMFEPLDPHCIIERRITELWEKLEETTENLNSCDNMLEMYFKAVEGKLNNKCPHCNKEISSKEVENLHEIIAPNPVDPKLLIDDISSSLAKIEKIVVSNNLSIEDLMSEEGITRQEKGNSGATYSNNEICQELQKVLLKLKDLEGKVVSHQTESELTFSKKRVEEEDKEVFMKTNGTVLDKQKPLEGDHYSPVQEESEISSMVTICIILSLVASALSTEIKENEKQQKRGIFGLGYGANLGYGIGIGNTGVLYSGSGLGVAGLGYSSLGLSGIGYGRSYGYAAAAPLTVATAPVTIGAAPVAVAPLARTVVSTPLVSRLTIPVQTHVTATPIATHVATPLRAHVAAPLAVATPITAHVTAAPVHAHIAAPLTAHAPVAAVTTHVATPVTHHVAAPVHITQPIAARITAPLSAPLTSVNIAYGRIGHGRALIH